MPTPKSKPKYRLSAMFGEETMADVAVVQGALSTHSIAYSGSISDAIRHALAFTAEVLKGVPGSAPTRPYTVSVVRAMQARG